MAESDKPKTLYTRQVIFKSDMANVGSTPNISYFVDYIIHDSIEETPVKIHSDDYEFTFIVLKDDKTGAVKVHDVRHNGRSIGKSDEWEDIVNNLINVNSVPSKSAFEINESFRAGSGLSEIYSFNSWSNTSGEDITSPDYTVIAGKITSDLTMTEPIVFTAQLTHS